MLPGALLRRSLTVAAAIGVVGVVAVTKPHADMISMEGVEPWDVCGECHGLDGAGNKIKFPRIAGQKPDYIVKQITDFREGRRSNDGGQMQDIATELKEADIPRVAKWFSTQTPSWPSLTIDEAPDPDRARKAAVEGIGGDPACLSCHSLYSPELGDKPIVAPRLAGQRDFYIVKQLKAFRDGDRGNDPEGIMRGIAKRLSDAEIASLAVFLSQNPQLHEMWQ